MMKNDDTQMAIENYIKSLEPDPGNDNARKMLKKLEQLRNEIDAIDDEFIDLLHRRSELSREVGLLKREIKMGVYDPSRERAVLDRLVSKVKPPLTRVLVQRIFTEIFSASRSLQKRIRISFLGSEGSFSHQAARCFSHAPTVPDKSSSSWRISASANRR